MGFHRYGSAMWYEITTATNVKHAYTHTHTHTHAHTFTQVLYYLRDKELGENLFVQRFYLYKTILRYVLNIPLFRAEWIILDIGRSFIDISVYERPFH